MYAEKLKIGPITVCVARQFPPIPTRKMDYCAYIDGDEERGIYGYGADQMEALDDLSDALDAVDDLEAAEWIAAHVHDCLY